MTSPEICHYARVLSIAGSDSGGAAGIQADLKTFAALGCYGMTAITAVTAQNTLGVSAIHSVPAEIVSAQIMAVVSDIGIDALKIGMLHSPDTVRAVVDAIRAMNPRPPIVLDPVMVASSGARLMAGETLAVMVRELFPLVSVITPNLDEAGWLLQRPVSQTADFSAAGADLLALGAPAVLLKGGHLTGDTLVDLLVCADGRSQAWHSPRIDSRNLHGTGCTLSSAIAAHLALGEPLLAAVSLARSYVARAIAAGAAVRTGAGQGPVNHGHAPAAMQLRAGGGGRVLPPSGCSGAGQLAVDLG
jgi:hydroxymethylpyrimidine/phosphomethylpyrimidine kinase